MVVQQPHGNASQEPRDAVNSVERAERGAPFVHGDHLGDTRAQSGVLRTQSRRPASDADDGCELAAEESQRQGQQRDQDSAGQNRNAIAVEQPSEEQRGNAIDCHGAGIYQGDHGGFGQAGFLKVITEQWKIHESAGEQRGRRRIDPEDMRQRLRTLRRGRRAAAGGIRRASGQQRGQCQHRGDRQPEESGSELIGARHRNGHQERTQHGAGLVERGMQAESPAVAHDAGGLGKQHVARRAAQRLAGAFGHHQQGCHLPVSSEGERGHYDEVQRVPANRDGPIGAGAVGEAAGEKAQAGGQHLAQAGDQAYLRGAGAEILQERADNAVRAFVRHVREKADYAQADDEPDGRRALLFRAHEVCTIPPNGATRDSALRVLRSGFRPPRAGRGEAARPPQRNAPSSERSDSGSIRGLRRPHRRPVRLW